MGFFGDEEARGDQSCRLVGKVNVKLGGCDEWMEKGLNVLVTQTNIVFQS